MKLPLIIAVALAVGACKGKGKGKDAEPAPRTRVTDAAAALADAAPVIPAGTATAQEATELCQRLFGAALVAIPKKCSAADLLLRPIPDETIQLELDSCLRVLGDASAAGRISFSPKRVACIEAQEKLARLPGRDHDHAWRPTTLPACVGLITGTQPLGAPCAEALECAGGLSCREGRCVGAAPLGAECSRGTLLDAFGDHEECLDGATCDGGVCRKLDPVVTWKRGAACDPDAIGICADGSYCDEAKRRCLPRKRAGSTCKEGFECRGECGAEQQCVGLCGSG